MTILNMPQETSNISALLILRRKADGDCRNGLRLSILVVGWCDGSELTSSTGASYNLEDSRAGAYSASSRCGRGMFGHLYCLLSFSPLSPSLWETGRYRLKYCLKGPLNPQQPINQIVCPSIWVTEQMIALRN